MNQLFLYLVLAISIQVIFSIRFIYIWLYQRVILKVTNFPVFDPANKTRYILYSLIVQGVLVFSFVSYWISLLPGTMPFFNSVSHLVDWFKADSWRGDFLGAGVFLILAIGVEYSYYYQQGSYRMGRDSNITLLDPNDRLNFKNYGFWHKAYNLVFQPLVGAVIVLLVLHFFLV